MSRSGIRHLPYLVIMVLCQCTDHVFLDIFYVGEKHNKMLHQSFVLVHMKDFFCDFIFAPNTNFGEKKLEIFKINMM
jgi:hypothetical protein